MYSRYPGSTSVTGPGPTIKEEMAIPSKLLEHVCQRIASRLFKDFPTIETIDIALYKENPPMGACAQRIGVEVFYQRD